MILDEVTRRDDLIESLRSALLHRIEEAQVAGKPYVTDRELRLLFGDQKPKEK